MKAGNFALAALAAALVAAHPFIRELLHQLRLPLRAADDQFQTINKSATSSTPPTLSPTPFGSRFLPMDPPPFAPMPGILQRTRFRQKPPRWRPLQSYLPLLSRRPHPRAHRKQQLRQRLHHLLTARSQAHLQAHLQLLTALPQARLQPLLLSRPRSRPQTAQRLHNHQV